MSQLVSSIPTHVPLVSCIMPTCDRRSFVAHAVDYFLRQDYTNRELIVVDDGKDRVQDLMPKNRCIHYIALAQHTSIGSKRNLACRHAQGDLILHWDDDDWYAPNRIRAQVEALLTAGGDICGLRQMLFYNSLRNETWLYEYPIHERRWLIGGSLLYRKSFWQSSPFPDIQVGEDTRFLWARALDRAVTLEDYQCYVAMIHPGNTSRKDTRGTYWQHWTGDLHKIMGADLERYALGGPRLSTDNIETKRSAAQHRASRQSQTSRSDVLPSHTTHVVERTVPFPSLHPGNKPALAPQVSCILATGDRRAFTRQAIRCFLRQTLEDSELIVVDDGNDTVEDLCAGLLRVRYLRLDQPASLGAKLNMGICHAHGQIIQKLDDDDYYHPAFLERAVASLPAGRRSLGIVAWDCFMVMLAGDPHLRYSGHGWAAGGTLCFPIGLWQLSPFRDLPCQVDSWFLHDHPGPLNRICAPELYLLVRHGRNTWTQTRGVSVDDYFASRPADLRPLEALVEPLDLEFYRNLIAEREAL